MDAFDLADIYRMPVMLLSDGIIGQMMEQAEFKERKAKKLPEKDWKLDGCKGRTPRKLYSLMQAQGMLEEHNYKLQRKHDLIKEKELRFELYRTEDAEVLITANGITGRISKGAVDIARKNGIKAGLIRPISLWPFPYDIINMTAKGKKFILCCEQNLGQMLDDVRLAAECVTDVHFSGKPGGSFHYPEEIYEEIKRIGGYK
jgi:2-oxoglutarate ferredoxin oxidoreductase subunit alpha